MQVRSSYRYRTFPFRAPGELTSGRPRRHPVIVVGAGPVGLCAAIDLALRGVPTLVLESTDRVSDGSRAICWAKRSLEILDRLGVAARVVEKGVTWQVGRVYYRDSLLYTFDLLAEPHHRFPAFVNLQQYYLEEYLVERAAELPAIELRWRNRVVGVETRGDHLELAVETPEGSYRTEADWLIAADGARSAVRQALGLGFHGRVSEDRFLITDLKMRSEVGTERRFWYFPPFHPGPSALMHRQADDVFRVDFQLGPDVDPEAEARPERVVPRLRAFLGEEAELTLEWISVYRFQSRRLERFVHGRVLFAGDAAHQLSPFGARGGNSGIQDAENLAWKLALVIEGRAPPELLETYDEERVYAADENLRITQRTTDFMSARTPAAKLFRQAALELAARYPFARALVNAGRLSTATVLRSSSLNTPDRDAFAGGMVPGAACADAPVRVATNGGCDGAEAWLLGQLGGDFVLLGFGAECGNEDLGRLAEGKLPLRRLLVAPRGPAPSGVSRMVDVEGVLAERYDGRPGTTYLIRPDAHVAARWRRFHPGAIRQALARATSSVG